MENATAAQAAHQEETGMGTKPSADHTGKGQLVTDDKKYFDSTKQISPSVPHPDFPDGRKSCIIRFPTDKEWCKRQHQLVSVSKTVGGDGTRIDRPGDEDANLELFKAIRIDQDGPEFDEAEASLVITRIERCIVQDSVRKGAQYTVTMKTYFGAPIIVTHTLKIPTQKQLMDFGKAAVDIIGRKQAVETRVALEPSADLWRGLVISATGYKTDQPDGLPALTTDIPILHKDAAINKVLAAMREDFLDDDPED